MEFVLAYIIGVCVSWIGLMIVVPIAGKLVGFGIPGLKEFAWKMAVIVAAAVLVAQLLALMHVVLGVIGSFVVVYAGMKRWLDADFLGVVVTCILLNFLELFLGSALAGYLP